MQTLSDLGTGAHGRFRTGVEKELATALTVLVDASTVNWNCDNKKLPMAKLTSSQSFTIDMTNVMDGAQGIFKLITNTASAITLTFDTSFTNKTLNSTILTYTFPALTAQEYFLSFVVDGTTIEWVIGDVTASYPLGTRLQRNAVQNIGSDGTNLTAMSFDVENADTAGMWVVGSPTRITVPGSGNKRLKITGWINWTGHATGERRWQFNKNGASVASTDGAFGRITPGNTGAVALSIACQLDCVAGDYFELMQFQNSTTTLSVTCSVIVTLENR